jgi:hypothetical protein
MLQTRFIVHDNIAIIFCVFIHLGFQDAVYIAVTALALGATHNQHIKIIFLDNRGAKFEICIIGLGHTGR